MNSIKLSILIPTFNYKLGVKKILDCIQNTDLDLMNNIEVIISDDSGNRIIDENTNKLIKKKILNYKYIHNENALGPVKNWNQLISIARGEYYWLLHHDEFWEKDKEMIGYILNEINIQKPNIIILPLQKEKLLNIQNIKLKITQNHQTLKSVLRKFILNPLLLIRVNIFGPPSIIIYKNNSMIYDESLKYLVDIDFYIRLFKNFKCKKIFFANQFFSILSSQNNKFSITRLIKYDIKMIKRRETEKILKKQNYKFKFTEKIFILYSYLILKINSLLTIRISLRR